MLYNISANHYKNWIINKNTLGIVWNRFPNFCVSASNKDLAHTKHKTGDGKIGKCQSECVLNTKCTAIEWYENGWDSAQCYLILDDVPAKKGSSSNQWLDAVCYIKPGI